MPFTLAHPAAILPLARRVRTLVLSALVVGSVVPDFEYVLPLGVARTSSHSLAGLFLFCLPVGFAVYLLWHLWFKRPVAALLPAAIGARLPASTDRGLPDASAALVSACLLAGATTHLLWDSFTHANGRMVQSLAWLQRPVFTIEHVPIAVYLLLQHASTLLGLGVIAFAAAHALRATPPGRPRALPLVLRTLVISALVLVPLACGWRAAPWAEFSSPSLRLFYRAAYLIVTAIIRGFGATLLVYATLWNLARLRRPARLAGTGAAG